MEGWISSAAGSTVEAAGQGGEGKPWPPWPPGFRFHPTDEELITFYLANKIHDAKFTHRAITEADLNSCEPWELPGKAQMGETEWYFYSLRDRKYPTGIRNNRATRAGYWKATGKDRAVTSSRSSKPVGMKKTLVFYAGRAPNGLKSNWVMHEYRTAHIVSPPAAPPLKPRTTPAQDEWTVCRIFHKTAGGKKVALADLQRPDALGGGGAAHVDAGKSKVAASLPARMGLSLKTTAATCSGPLPSPHLSSHIPPRNAHPAINLLKPVPSAASTSSNNFSALPDDSLETSSALTALFQTCADSPHDQAMSLQYHAVKPDPSSKVDVTASRTSARCSDYAPRINTSRLPLTISFDANNIVRRPKLLPDEALSDICTSTEFGPLPPNVDHLPQPRRGLPSDLENPDFENPGLV